MFSIYTTTYLGLFNRAMPKQVEITKDGLWLNYINLTGAS